MQLDATTEAIKTAIGSHGIWKLKLSTAARTGDASLPVETLRVEDACDFGKWLKQVAPQMAGDPDYAKIREMHRLFHADAGRLAAMIRDGQGEQAMGELEDGGRFARQSKALTEAMADWRMALRHRH